MLELTEEDIGDFVEGAAILGTGGGGDPAKGAEILREDRRAGRRLTLTALEDLQGREGVLVVPYLVGTIAQSSAQQSGVAELIRAAIEAFEAECHKEVRASGATEVGGLNSAMALHAAAHAGIPAVDADVVGRAAPETCHTVLNLAGLPLVPAVVAVGPTDMRFLREAMSPERYESTIRGLSADAKGYVAVVDSPCRPRDVLDVLIRGSLSRALALGRARRGAAQAGGDPVDAVRRALDGRLLFRGRVSGVATRDEGGFLRGTATLDGVGAWRGQTFESLVINEHILARRGRTPVVLPPDCFAFLDGEGRAIMNNALEDGAAVSVLAWRAPAPWRTPAGLALFGPRHFGFDLDYVPVETLAGF